jgi:DeoR/GlpR family transcriptional regulator of sugar metabolism
VLAINRKKTILEELRRHKSININELAERFQLSRETIRRDIRDFEGRGILKKIHGGAVIIEADEPAAASGVTGPYFAEPPIDKRRSSHTLEKEAICRAAASRIADKEVVYIDNSSTTIPLVKYIPRDLSVSILTNSLIVIMEAYNLRNPNLSLFCVPGFFNANNLSLYGTHTVRMVDEFFPSKAFISCAAILPDSRLADSSMYETDTKRAFIKKSDTVYLLADSDKFNKTAPYFLADMESIDYIVTDKSNPDFNWHLLESKSVETLFAGNHG